MGGGKQKRKTSRRKLRQKAQRHLTEARRLQRRSLVGPWCHQEAMMIGATMQMAAALAALSRGRGGPRNPTASTDIP